MTYVHFDVWVNGPAEPPDDRERRAELLKRIEASHLVDKQQAGAFVGGARLRLRRGIDQDAALRTLAELQALGLSVEVEPNRPPDDAILTLDQFQAPEPEPAPSPASEAAFQLVTLDGEEQTDTKPMALPGRASSPATSKPAAKAHVDRFSSTVVEPKPSPRAPSPSPRAELPTEIMDESRFLPPSDSAILTELQLEAPTTPIALKPRAAPEPEPAVDLLPPDDEPTRARPLLQAAPVELGPVPGRLMQGALRARPPVRIGAGVALGLLLGFLFAQPFSSRVERRVTTLRAQADQERYRPVAEAQARVAALDAEADAQAARGAVGTGAIWLIVAGAAFAGWWRLT